MIKFSNLKHHRILLRFLPIFSFFQLSLTHAPALALPETKSIDGVTYRILVTNPESLRISWKDHQGKIMRTMPETANYFATQGIKVSTMMNGGIFEPGGIPSGLFVQDGKELNPVNRNSGKGNFFLHPNGIFLLYPDGAAVIRTDEYPVAGRDVRFAVQSGPLLLRKGIVHPAFNAESTSRLHRNGVGVTKSGTVVLAITDFHSPKFPNLYEFSQLFRGLDCEDALFLDGDLSQMKSGDEMLKPSNLFATIISVVENERAKP